MFYALRYLPGVPLNQRKHVHTIGRWDDYDEAAKAREERPVTPLLEVVVRHEPEPEAS